MKWQVIIKKVQHPSRKYKSQEAPKTLPGLELGDLEGYSPAVFKNRSGISPKVSFSRRFNPISPVFLDLLATLNNTPIRRGSALWGTPKQNE